MSLTNKSKPHILLTNDDGVYAPGIKHLYHYLSSFATVTVIAPSSEQSAVGLSITVRHPLHIEKVSWYGIEEANIWAISGTPADCVKLGLRVILDNPPDLIISGINRGGNAGRNTFYSGTVAAVVEGLMHDVPGIALSAGDFTDTHYEAIEPYVAPLVTYVLENPLPLGTLLNVNFPKRTCGDFKGVRMSEQGLEYWRECPEKRDHPTEDKSYYWLGAEIAMFDETSNSDSALLKEGWVTATPIHVRNLTHTAYLKEKKETFETVFKHL